MAKKKKKYKWVEEDKLEEYKNLSEVDLIAKIKKQHAYLETAQKKKKDSSVLKELRGEVNEFRKIWKKKYPEKVKEIEDLKADIKAIESKRDAKIMEDLDEKKLMEGGFNDSIAGAKEHMEAMVFC